MPVAASDDQIGPVLFGHQLQLVSVGLLAPGANFSLCPHSMPLEMTDYVLDASGGGLELVLASDDLKDVHGLRELQERQRVPDGSPRFPGVLPSDKDALRRQPAAAGRNDKQGPTKPHEQIAGVRREVNAGPLALEVTSDHDEIR